MSNLPTKRSEALAVGSMFYNTGKPCIRGHYAPRYAKKGTCKECAPILDAQDHYKPKRNARMQIWLKTAEEKLKHAARSKVLRAIRSGRITKQPCERCGTDAHVHAHHDDYSKPLEIMWLCAQHHKDRHREIESHIVKHGLREKGE